MIIHYGRKKHIFLISIRKSETWKKADFSKHLIVKFQNVSNKYKSTDTSARVYMCIQIVINHGTVVPVHLQIKLLWGDSYIS